MELRQGTNYFGRPHGICRRPHGERSARVDPGCAAIEPLASVSETPGRVPSTSDPRVEQGRAGLWGALVCVDIPAQSFGPRHRAARSRAVMRGLSCAILSSRFAASVKTQLAARCGFQLAALLRLCHRWSLRPRGSTPPLNRICLDCDIIRIATLRAVRCRYFRGMYVVT